VVIGGERQRPGAEHAVVVGQQLRGRLSGAERIETLIDDVVDAHVHATGGPHELPEPRRPHLRVGRGGERGLHVRQRRQLGGQAQTGEGPRDVGFPGAAAHDATLEAIRLAELEAHAARGLQQALAGAGGAPLRQYALHVGRQGLRGGSRRQRGGHGSRGQFERLDVTCAGRIHRFAPQRRLDAGRELEPRIDHGEVPLVVQETLARADLGIDADPEIDVRLQFDRSGDRSGHDRVRDRNGHGRGRNGLQRCVLGHECR